MPVLPRAFYQVLRLHQIVSTRLEETLAPAGLTASQYTLLSIVRHLQPTTSAELARWLQVSAQSTGEALKLLQDRELVLRSESEANRRIVVLTLTPAGTRLLTRADTLVAAAEEAFFGTLSATARTAFDQAVQALRRAAEPPHLDTGDAGTAEPARVRRATRATPTVAKAARAPLPKPGGRSVKAASTAKKPEPPKAAKAASAPKAAIAPKAAKVARPAATMARRSRTA